MTRAQESDVPPPAGDADAIYLGLRAGYAHGYEIGLAHGRTAVLPDPAADMPAPGLAGPDRGELIERGYILRDPSRPPALPTRLWTADDWVEADARDLPTTEVGRKAWRDAVQAGLVPARLVEAFTAARSGGTDGAAPSSSEATADAFRATVADTGRRIAELCARVAERECAAAMRADERERRRPVCLDADVGRRDGDPAVRADLLDRAGGR